MSEEESACYELSRDEFDLDLRHHLEWVRKQFGDAKSRERAAQIAAALACLNNHNGVVCASG